MKALCLTVFILSLLLSGCAPGSHGVPYSDTGEVLLQATVTGMSSTASYADITFTQGRHSVPHQLPISGHSLAGSIVVPVGVWDIHMVLYDSEGSAQYQDQVTDVMVQPDQSTAVEFQLRPANALVQVFIDVANYPAAHEVFRARVYFGEHLEEINRETLEEPLIGEYSLAPGSYDFSVQLYTDSFRISDRVFTGTWHVIDVEPADELTIQWEPEMESVTITANIHQLPRAPEDLQISVVEHGVQLSWLPSPDEVQGYRVYWQPSPWEPFGPLQEAAISDCTFVHEEETHGLFAVAAVSPIGIEGYRTPPIQLTAP